MDWKCLEKIKGKDQYHLKHQTSFTIKLDRGGTYETLHNVIRNHYKIPAKTITYLGDYKGQTVETTFRDAASFAFAQRDKKRSLQLYLYYPKSFSKLQFDILLEENKKLSSSSDDEDFNLDSTHVQPSWNGVINLAETSDQEQPTSVTDVENSNHSMTCIQSEKSKRLFCKNCSCTYTALDGTCLTCETDKSYEQTLAEDKNKAAPDKDILSKDVCQNQHEQGNQDLMTRHEMLSTQDLRYAPLRHFRNRQMPVRYRHSMGSPISIKDDHQNETPMTVEFLSKISPAVNKTNETEKLEYNELEISSCLDLRK